MGQSLYESSAAARAAFDTMEGLRPGTIAQCFSGAAEELKQTINTQPCLFAVDYACAAALQEHGIEADMACGFSLGEVAAAAYCGLLSLVDAFRLVMKRAEYMQACAEKNPGSMAAVIGVDARTVEAVCEDFTNIYPVNYNSGNQTVVSIAADADLASFSVRMQQAGARLIPLKVGGCFHSPLREEASDKLRAYMDSLSFSAPRIPLYANATALPDDDARESLRARQVKSPVYFHKTVENRLSEGLTHCIEVGAGKTLSGLLQKIGGAKRIMNVQDAESLEHTLQILREEGLSC
jgi:[acyl-carrier-protein] S-malonyltransferase